MCAELGMCICYDWIALLVENEPNAYGKHFCVMTETNVVLISAFQCAAKCNVQLCPSCLQHFLLRSECEHLIRQGILEHTVNRM